MWGPRDPRTHTSLASIFGYALTFLAPAYYPVSALPPFLQNASLLFYTTNLSLIGKNIIRHESGPLLNIGIIIVYLIASLILLFKIARWKSF